MTCWHSLYLPYVDNLIEPLSRALTALGYESYTPFGLMPGKAYAQSVKLFVAPAQGGWTRIIGTLDAALLPELSRLAPCLMIELDVAEATLSAYADGAPAPLTPTFNTYTPLPDCLDRALNGLVASDSAASVGGISVDALPSDVQAMAKGVDLRQAGKLFERMNATLSQKAGGDPAAAELLKQPDWSSAGGQRIHAVMDCLNIPNWQQPDFVTLRNAYALHERRRRRPKAMLYPGDAEALAAVPDALDYTPVYAGKA